MSETCTEVSYDDDGGSHSLFIDEEVIEYINKRATDFRISTSCGGPALLPIAYKPPKSSDIVVKAGNYRIYISLYQARYVEHIHMGLVPFHTDSFPSGI